MIFVLFRQPQMIGKARGEEEEFGSVITANKRMKDLRRKVDIPHQD